MKTFKQLYNEGKMDLELLKLYNKAMRVMPNSPAQKKIIDQINKRMIKLGMKPSMMQQEDGHTAVAKVRADHKREKEHTKKKKGARRSTKTEKENNTQTKKGEGETRTSDQTSEQTSGGPRERTREPFRASSC